MEYYKVNYKKLERLHQIDFYIIICLTIILFNLLFIISCFKYIDNYQIVYGIINDNILKIKINNKLSDKLKNQNRITFNNHELKYELNDFNDYEIVNNDIFVTVDLKIDGNFYQNEVGEVKLYFGKQLIIKYILELFK